MNDVVMAISVAAEKKGRLPVSGEAPCDFLFRQRQTSLMPQPARYSLLVYLLASSLLLNFMIRIALLPVVAGISYEIIRLSAKKEGGWFFKLITKPGVWLQNVTTKEPDDQQLEVAIEALKESLKLEPKPTEPALAPMS